MRGPEVEHFEEVVSPVKPSTDSAVVVPFEDLTLLESQAGGCRAILCKDGLLYKPTSTTEVCFYETVSEGFPELLPFLAEFNGWSAMDAEAFSRRLRQCACALRAKEVATGMHESDEKVAVDKVIDEIATGKAAMSSLKTYVKCAKASTFWTHYIDTKKLGRVGKNKSHFIVLSDLTAKYTKACVLDLKIGVRVRHWSEFADASRFHKRITKCWNSTSPRIALRFCGMQLWNAALQKFVEVPRGIEITCDEFVAIVKQFVGPLLATASGKTALSRIVENLEQLKAIFEKPCAYRFLDSSLLFIYEGDAESEFRAQMNVIDFGNVLPLATEATAGSGRPVRMHPEVDSVHLPDAGICWALHSLSCILKDIGAAKTVERSDDEWAKWSQETCPFYRDAIRPLVEAKAQCRCSKCCAETT